MTFCQGPKEDKEEPQEVQVPIKVEQEEETKMQKEEKGELPGILKKGTQVPEFGVKYQY